ncbi:shikimate kinase [Rhodopseudomonas julia]|uniref:Shikimate kinase n=1 Tax=Rhodopseudomonas julia TaxID=200617 RepID=A0ABU0CA10_9BRAD|nr:shikimate kinase [Rhodopseudomonas julia]MDQ0325912.1 shikimate kinase [Rhodopseudomonas julia]
MLRTESKKYSRIEEGAAERVVERLGARNIVLVGMMGAGKTSVGRRLAATLNLPFKDADQEIEAAANLTIADIFATYGEAHFREGEKKVIRRLLTTGPTVIATGGGAFEDAETRQAIANDAVSIWLKADLDLLFDRVRRRSNRPLLRKPNPKEILADLLARREPTYALATLTVASRDVPHHTVVADVLSALDKFLTSENPS